MNKIRIAWLSAISLVAAIFFVSGCENSGTFTEEVLPVDDPISTHYVDTIPIKMTSIWTDVSETYRADRQMFGNYIDPLFGRITAETFSEVLPRSNLDFGEANDLFYDSIVLKLDIEGTYGRFATPQTLHIYELTETFPEADQIDSRTRLTFDSSHDLGGGYLLDLDETNGVAQLTIRLDDELGRRLLFANSDTLEDKDLFQQLFPGFYFGTDPVTFLSREPGGIYTLFGSSSNTQLELHYKQREPGTQVFVSKIEPFLISNSTPRFTYLNRSEFSDSFLASELSQTDTSSQFEFVQAGLLIKNFIQFSNIDQLGQVAISRAELVLSVDPESLGGSQRFNPPSQLLSIFADENGEEVQIDGSPILASQDAVYNSITKTYSISLTSYVQQLVNEQRENFGIVLRPQGSQFRINRAVFGGTDHPSLQPKLAITYTTLPR
ncbi:MAG: DUF4270 family protein [Bacteroidota bacterium]